MPKRADISKILVNGFGWLTAIAVWCLIVAGIAVGECVEVQPFYEPSSANVRIATVRNGDPLKNVKVELHRPEWQQNFSLSTNDDGVAMLLALRTGKQCITAMAPDETSAELCLDVSSNTKGKITSFSIELPPSAAQQELAKAEDRPIDDRVQEFRGIVEDPSGAVLAGIQIEVFQKGASDRRHAVKLKSDASGHFSTDLESGVYIAFFRMPGFRTYFRVFEVC
jgi:hypothetical protein